VPPSMGVDSEESSEGGVVGSGSHFDGWDESWGVFERSLVLAEPGVVEVPGDVVGQGSADQIAVGVVGEGAALFAAGHVGGSDNVTVDVRVRPHRRGTPNSVGDPTGQGHDPVEHGVCCGQCERRGVAWPGVAVAVCCCGAAGWCFGAGDDSVGDIAGVDDC
jgi:hypothetical protein